MIDPPRFAFPPAKRYFGGFMHCPFCDAEKESLKVIDSRTCEGGRAIRRRRQCLLCKKRFTTYERIEEPMRLIVVKKDGRRVPWDRSKILTGLERACFKRPVPEQELLRIVDEVEEETFKTYDREVPSTVVGEMVTDRLRRLDQVAYVRFASVYRRFKTLEELVDEAKAVIDAKRYEDPDQGKLFLEEQEKRRMNGQEAPPPQEAPAPKRERKVRRDPAEKPRKEPAEQSQRTEQEVRG
jgi:transcriptional repressor NrdR